MLPFIGKKEFYMLIRIINGSVSFGADTVLENVDFEIQGKEKVAIVGRNGCGKTTLLKAITGELTMEEGTGDNAFSFVKSGNPVIGHLKQIAFEDQNATMLDEILKVFSPLIEMEEKINRLVEKMATVSDEKTVKTYSNLCERYELLGGYTYKKEYSVMIKKFGFSEEDKQKLISEFSGGQRTKIAFMKLLLSHPDVLILDEPTNHLDLSTIKWLEDYLKNYKSAVIMVSHDRMFVEKTVDKVYEIEYGETRCYKGNYSSFEKQKRENYEKMLKDHEIYRAEVDRLTKLIERFRYKATKAKMVQSKIKQIERMKVVNAPSRYDLNSSHANFEPNVESVKLVLTAKDLQIGYDKPLANINLELFRGEKLGVIGDNGIGKSTFLKTLVSKITQLSGEFEFGLKTQIGYFDQQMAQYTSNKTVIDDFHDEFPFLTETEVRNSLGAFLFSGEDVFKEVSSLSGGERVRLNLCKIFKRRPNLLILDEPTNHMDIVGKETLENMLKSFSGTVIFVSHDRYFVNKVADKLLIFENGKTEFFPYNYAEYELVLSERQKAQENATTIIGETVKTDGIKEKKTFTTPLKERGKKERRLKKLEELISESESQIESFNKRLEDPNVYSDYLKVSELQEKIDALNKAITDYTTEWETLIIELEN